MARNGAGTYSLPSGNPVVTGTTISSTWANNTLTDIGTALTASIANDGQTPITANLPMSNFRHTGVANATARTNYASAADVQDGTPTYLTGTAGTNTITATAAYSMAAYVTGQRFTFVSAGANTGAVTVNINSIGAKNLTKNGTAALVSGDIPSGAVVEITYDGTEFQITRIKQGTAGTYDVGTSGATIPLLNGNNTHSGDNIFSGSNIYNVVSKKTANYVITTSDFNKILYAETGGGNVQFTLPENATSGARLWIYKTSSTNTASVVRTGGDLIYQSDNWGVPSVSWTAIGEIWEFFSDGADWGAGRIATTACYSSTNTVPQAGLKTTTAASSTPVSSSSTATYALTGGTYSWWTAGGANGGGSCIGFAAGDTAAGTIGLGNTSGSGNTFYVDERYVQASPPYLLGPLFVTALMDSSATLAGLSVSIDPVWANHGPTKIASQYVRNGKDYRQVKLLDGIPLESAKKDKALLRRFLQGEIDTSEQEVEVTLAYKDSDKDIVPHPWIYNPAPFFSGKTVLMLEPGTTLMDRLHKMLEDGSAKDVHQLITDGYIQIQNTELKVPGMPAGVKCFGAQWKLT
jgi:hypothetical protein